MKLGEPEPVGVLDHHNRRLRHVDPDLDHRRRHQDLRRAPPERVHDLLFFLRAHSTVQHTQWDVAEHLLAEALGQTNGGFDLKLLGFFDQRADDVCLPPRAYLFANPRVHLRAFLRTAHVGPHGTPPGGHFVEDRNVQITVESHGQGPWNRRRRHDQDVWVESLPSECGPLRDSKLVLLVHHHQPESAEGHALLQERVCADGYIDVSRPQRITNMLAFTLCRPAGYQAHPHPQRRQEPAEGQVVLLGKDFRGGHQRPLVSTTDT